MKIAIYLAGHLRTFDDYIKDSLKQFMYDDKHQFDLYVSTYYKIERDGSHGSDTILNENEIRYMFKDLPLKKIQLISDEWTVKCLSCDNEALYGNPKYISFKTGEIGERKAAASHCNDCKTDDMILTDGVSYWQQWRHVWNCYNMAKNEEKINNFKYDYHVRSRPDIVYLEQVDFNKLPPLTTNLYSGFGCTLGHPDDMFAIGNGEAWDHYCDIKKVLLYTLSAHELTDYTFMKYPVIKQIQLGVIRYRNSASSTVPVTVKKLKDGKFFISYDKKIFNIN